MRVLLRCDGGPGVGVGHVMRSLALAEEATSRGHEVSLAGIVEGDLLTRAVAGSGLFVHPVAGRLGDSGDLPDRAVWDTHDVVHVDSYTVSSAVRESLGTGPVLSVMHDGHDGRRSADLAIDPTLGAEATPAPEDAAWSVRGGRWVPLRPAIRRLSGRHPDRSTGDRLDVVVVMGGADPARCAPDAVAAVQAAATRAGVAVDVLVVASPETRDRLTAMTERPGATVTVIDPTPDLASRLAVADLVVSAAGTTVWELCALRTPMALVCVVDNQQTGYDEVIRRGMAAGLGTPADLSAEETTTTLADLLGDPAARAELAETADRVVDGLGAWRIVSAWEALVTGARPAAQGGTPRHTAPRDASGMSVRPATVDDADLLLEWRNDPTTRAASRTNEAIARADHMRWLEATLARDDRRLLVAADHAGPVGTVRWDREAPGEWEVSITVATTRRGAGLARPLLQAGERWLLEAADRAEVDGLSTYLAVVHDDNVSSRRLFTGAGYLPDTPATSEGFARYLRLAR